MVAAGIVVEGRYEVLGRLGAGTYADQYRARHIALRSLLAVKVLRTSLHPDRTCASVSSPRARSRPSSATPT